MRMNRPIVDAESVQRQIVQNTRSVTMKLSICLIEEPRILYSFGALSIKIWWENLLDVRKIIQSPNQVRGCGKAQSLSQDPSQDLNQDQVQSLSQDLNQDRGRSQDPDQDQGLGSAVETLHITTDRIRIIIVGSTGQGTKLTTIGATSPSITIIDMSIGQLGHLHDQGDFEEKVLLQALKNWIINA